ncbi:hypothetical protein [Parascardovia denticolens]
MEDFTYLVNKDEKDIIFERTRSLSPLLSIIETSYADVCAEEKQEFFSRTQYSRRRSESTNMRTRNRWEQDQKDNLWKIVDPDYTHLRDEVTRMRLELHPVRGWGDGLPKPANTISARARYTQSKCLSADAIQLNMFHGDLVPDLSKVLLVAAWQIIDGQVYITIYKPTDPKRDLSCLGIPLLGDSEKQSKIRFVGSSENEMLIPKLVDEPSKASWISQTEGIN